MGLNLNRQHDVDSLLLAWHLGLDLHSQHTPTAHNQQQHCAQSRQLTAVQPVAAADLISRTNPAVSSKQGTQVVTDRAGAWWVARLLTTHAPR
jgi:hypothetical protein